MEVVGCPLGGGLDVEGFAQDLFSSKTKSGIEYIYKFLQADLANEKATGEWDQDMSYWVIDKYGVEYFFGPDHDNAATRKEFKKPDISYISMQGPDGRDDSIGYHSWKDGHSRISNDSDYEDRYDSEINRMFNTRWGKKHPR